MSLWLVIPLRSLRDGKSRLAPALDPDQRYRLVEWLLTRTLEQAAQFPGLDRTLVVSPCEQARARALAGGAQVLEEHAPGGLNHALRQAQLVLRGFEAARMLMISCDLPLLQAEDLQRLADASSATTIALAPDRAHQGTNAICLGSELDFEFSFGPDSLERHVARVRRLGKRVALVERDGLAFDLDLPADLTELEQRSQNVVGFPSATFEMRPRI
jgi:2-phospho-L-lactate guanylyltransferase